MILKVLEPVLGIFVVLGLWYAFETFVRKRSGAPPDHDALEYMAHGCAGCDHSGKCHNKVEGEEHHEPV